MIAYLKGKVKFKSNFIKKDNYLIIDVAGVGYKAYVLDILSAKLIMGNEVELYIYTQVAEGVLDLYGFESQEQLEFFERLISISGIGPRSALGILQKAKIEDLTKAAQSGDYETLAKVSGIGPKTAQKIVIGLKDKLGGVDFASDWSGGFADALDALIGLGYSAGQARDALSRCTAQDMGEQVKEALKILGRRGS